MAWRVVLIVSADAERQLTWQQAVRAAGHWPLAAETPERARGYLRKVRPHLIVADARSLSLLLDEIHTIPPLAHVPLVVVGALNSDDSSPAEHTPAIQSWPSWPADAPLAALLDDSRIA